MHNRGLKIFAVLALLSLITVLVWRFAGPSTNRVESPSVQSSIRGNRTAKSSDARAIRPTSAKVQAPSGTAAVNDADSESVTEEEAPQTEEERREAEEEKRVNAFDALTDGWMEASSSHPVTMADVEKFCEQFRKVPKSRQEECLQRALNLIPDENVMLLAGILMDKSQDKELVELVYNDILNRDEDVKKPILAQIFKDRNHPCWADTAWILDVTGELPKKSE